MKKLTIYICICISLFSTLASAQWGFEIPLGYEKVEIPFDYENNFIIVDVSLNHTLPLRMIFDTGAEHTILCHKNFTDELKVSYDKEFSIIGSDFKTVLKCFLAKNISIETTQGGVKAQKQNILVLAQDYFRLEESVGAHVQGILGADLFNHYVVKINYVRHVITLYPADGYVPPSDYVQMPIQVHNGKPFISPTLTLENDTKILSTFLMDTGARLSLLLYTHSHPELVTPKQVIQGNIGYGLGGSITGYAGRVKRLDFSKSIYFEELLADFQDFSHGADTSNVIGRNGIIGNDILNRFTVILDYIHHQVYLKPNKDFRQAFEYDKSGLMLVAGGLDLNHFYVQYVIKNSPASEADIHVDDRLLSINRMPTSLMSLQDINRRFRAHKNKKMRLVFLRNGEHIVKFIYLRKLI
jgi:hypothetical protein